MHLKVHGVMSCWVLVLFVLSCMSKDGEDGEGDQGIVEASARLVVCRKRARSCCARASMGARQIAFV